MAGEILIRSLKVLLPVLDIGLSREDAVWHSCIPYWIACMQVQASLLPIQIPSNALPGRQEMVVRAAEFVIM